MPNLTPIYGFYLPLIADAIDEDLWGGYLNDNFMLLDTVINISDTSAVSSSPYTVLTTDKAKTLLVDGTSGPIIINLLAAATAGDGFVLTVKKIDSTSSTITLDGDGSETIDGALTFAMGVQNQAVEIVCNGTGWYIRDSYVKENVVSVSSTPYTGTLKDLSKTLLIDATSGAITVNLVSAVIAGAGFEMSVKKTDSSSNIVTIDASTTETIDGSLTYLLSSQYATVTLVSNGTNWAVKSTNAASVISKSYVSSEQALPAAAGNLTLAHGLGAVPVLVRAVLRCKTAENGWSIGDEICVTFDRGDNWNYQVTANSTSIIVTIGLNGYDIYNTSGSQAFITAGNWRFIVYAYA